MRCLNIGCGCSFVSSEEWINLDFEKSGEGVIPHNLLAGIPFCDDHFDVVYHSHLLEHFSNRDGAFIISECYRVLKPGGIIRIAVPDLEGIVKEYLACLEKAILNPKDEVNRSNYDWIMLELLDQIVRDRSGGDMAAYYLRDTIINESYLNKRIGLEWQKDRSLMNDVGNQREVKPSRKNLTRFLRIKYRRVRGTAVRWLMRLCNIDESAYAIGRFRLGGEIHQWMYDSYSLSRLLSQKGFSEVTRFDAFNSYIDGWATFTLDGKDQLTRKPDSLFMEARK